MMRNPRALKENPNRTRLNRINLSNKRKALRTSHAIYASTRVIKRNNVSCHASIAKSQATKPKSVASDLKQPNKKPWVKMSQSNRLFSPMKSRATRRISLLKR